jgi:capsular polysaccharide transport system permease protein
MAFAFFRFLSPSPTAEMADAPSRAFGLRARIANQFRVVRALMIRNIMAKYGRGNLGFLWLVVEPMFLVSGVIVLWSYTHGDGAHGIPVAAFVVSGYMPLTLWRHLSNAVRVMSMNYGLLYHRRITVFDIVIARALTEVIGVSAAGLVVYFLLLSVGLVDWIAEPSLVLLGWVLMIWFSFGAGCIVTGISEKSEVLENLIQPIQYLLIPLSGCFYMVSWLPKAVQDYIVLVPLVNIYELFRHGFFGDAVVVHYSISYIILFCVVLTALGFWSIASSRKKLTGR